MNIVIFIQGRDAIPVRALPFVTKWSLSPDAVATELAESTDPAIPPRLHNLRAWYRDEQGELVEILPKQWDCIAEHLQALQAELKASGNTREERRPSWRKKSIGCLPAGVFVWRDEFEEAFSSGDSRYNREILDEPDGDRGYTFFPLIPEPLQGIVIEGFSHFAMAIESHDSIGDDPTRLDGQLHRAGLGGGELLNEEQLPGLAESDTISWAECRAKLKRRLGAYAEEVSFWIVQGWHHAGDGMIQAYAQRAPNGFHRAVTIAQCDERDKSVSEILGRYKYNRAEIEGFSPVTDADPGPVEKLSARWKQSDWITAHHNPSGRFLAFDDVVAFLLALPGLAPESRGEIVSVIKDETDRAEITDRRIMPLRPFGIGVSDKARIEEAWYPEGAILMLAMEHWGGEI